MILFYNWFFFFVYLRDLFSCQSIWICVFASTLRVSQSHWQRYRYTSENTWPLEYRAYASQSFAYDVCQHHMALKFRFSSSFHFTYDQTTTTIYVSFSLIRRYQTIWFTERDMNRHFYTRCVLYIVIFWCTCIGSVSHTNLEVVPVEFSASRYTFTIFSTFVWTKVSKHFQILL